MLAYSAKKKIANAIPEYSTWNPATISDSPSATSNGARLVSATLAIQYTKNSGNNGIKYQCHNPPFCFKTNSDKFMVPDIKMTPTNANPNAISYDTTCAALRNAPNKAYFEFDAQPPTKMPYTPSDVIANK